MRGSFIVVASMSLLPKQFSRCYVPNRTIAIEYLLSFFPRSVNRSMPLFFKFPNTRFHNGNALIVDESAKQRVELAAHLLDRGLAQPPRCAR